MIIMCVLFGKIFLKNLQKPPKIKKKKSKRDQGDARKPHKRDKFFMFTLMNPLHAALNFSPPSHPFLEILKIILFFSQNHDKMTVK